MVYEKIQSNNKKKTVESEQKHDQYGGYNDMSLSLTVKNGDISATVLETSSSYSDPDGMREDSSSSTTTYLCTDGRAQDFYAFCARYTSYERITNSYKGLSGACITFVSTQQFDMSDEEMCEYLWMSLYIVKNSIMPRYTSYGARELAQCTMFTAMILERLIGANKDNAHLIVYHTISHISSCAGSETIAEKAEEYGWNIDDILAIGTAVYEDYAQSKLEVTLRKGKRVKCGDAPLNAYKIIIPEGYTHILNMAFNNCELAAEIQVPSTVISIGEYAFARTKIKSIDLPEGLKEIKASAFGGCEQLEEVIIPESVEAICDGAFAGCKSLKRVVLPNKCIKIDRRAFARCPSLQEVVIYRNVQSRSWSSDPWKSVSLPEDTNTLLDYAFDESDNVKFIIL